VSGVPDSAGITQADLAFAMQVSQPMLSRQEQPFRRLRPATVQRALEALRRIQENRARPAIALESVLNSYGKRLAESAARKPRDPVERRLLQEGGDPVALRESDANVREGGARRRPPRGEGSMTGSRWHYAPSPIGVPGTLLDAFEQLKAEMGQTWPSAD
jgi:transcriptional regulator with XRE-family HTH domain